MRARGKRSSENEMIGWYHPLNGYESEKTLGDGEGQGGQVCAAVHGVAKRGT